MITKKPKPPLIEVHREDGGPFWWERAFCWFGWHSFQENVRYCSMGYLGHIHEKDIYEKQCVCCGAKGIEI